MHNKSVVILGTGGTIAGTSDSPSDTTGYTAAQLSIRALVHDIPALEAMGHIVVEQVAQIDSKDASFEMWAHLAGRVNHYLAMESVQGVVITHGTDTLEETAFFLQSILCTDKPVVLTCAMRPATALYPDGPQNLLDAVLVAKQVDARGVLVVCAGVIHNAKFVQKVHTSRLNAFCSGDAGPIGQIEDNTLKLLQNWPAGSKISSLQAKENIAKLIEAKQWPRVEVVLSYAGASGAVVEALVAQGVQGLVVAGTGNGTIHHELEVALLKAMAGGVVVVRATRCVYGHVTPKTGDMFGESHGLSPVKARIALILRLMALNTEKID